MKNVLFTVCLLSIVTASFAQPSFLDGQRNYPNVALALKYKEDTLVKQFTAAGLKWPPRQIYIRSFKYDSQLEVWVRNTVT